MDISKYIKWENGDLAHITEYDEEEDLYYVECVDWRDAHYFSVNFVRENSKPANILQIIKFYFLSKKYE